MECLKRAAIGGRPSGVSAVGRRGLTTYFQSPSFFCSPTGRGAARLARLLWEQEVLGSNPSAPTAGSRFAAGFPVRASSVGPVPFGQVRRP